MARTSKNSTSKRAHSPDAEPSAEKHPRVDAEATVGAEEEEDGSDTEWAIVSGGTENVSVKTVQGSTLDKRGAENVSVDTVQGPALEKGLEASGRGAIVANATDAPKPTEGDKELSLPHSADAVVPGIVDVIVVNSEAATASAAKGSKADVTVNNQPNLDAFGVVSVAANADVPDEDKINIKVHYPSNAKKRFNGLLSYSSTDESIYATRLEPFNLDWSSQNIKGSRLIVPGQVTPVQIWILGELTWNGLLAIGQEWPARAKVGVAPLRSGDLIHARQIVKRYSKSKKDLDVNNIMAVSAHTDMASRVRGAASAEAKPFHKIFDGRQLMTPDKSDMDLLQPKDLMRGDVVLVEVSVGRYWDDSENGRIKDWASTRAFFHLEAVTLIVNGVDEGAAVGNNGAKGKKKLIVL